MGAIASSEEHPLPLSPPRAPAARLDAGAAGRPLDAMVRAIGQLLTSASVTDMVALDRHRYMILATFRRSGVEVRTPVWFAAVDGKIYLFSAGESGKVKRVRHSPRARVAPSDMRGRVRGAWGDAAARIVTEPGLIARARAALRAKYGGQMWLGDLFSRLTGRIQRRAWIEIEI